VLRLINLDANRSTARNFLRGRRQDAPSAAICQNQDERVAQSAGQSVARARARANGFMISLTVENAFRRARLAVRAARPRARVSALVVDTSEIYFRNEM